MKRIRTQRPASLAEMLDPVPQDKTPLEDYEDSERSTRLHRRGVIRNAIAAEGKLQKPIRTSLNKAVIRDDLTAEQKMFRADREDGRSLD